MGFRLSFWRRYWPNRGCRAATQIGGLNPIATAGQGFEWTRLNETAPGSPWRLRRLAHWAPNPPWRAQKSSRRQQPKPAIHAVKPPAVRVVRQVPLPRKHPLKAAAAPAPAPNKVALRGPVAATPAMSVRCRRRSPVVLSGTHRLCRPCLARGYCRGEASDRGYPQRPRSRCRGRSKEHRQYGGAQARRMGDPAQRQHQS